MAKRSLQQAAPAVSSKKPKLEKGDSSCCSEEKGKPERGKERELQALAEELQSLYTGNAVPAVKAAKVFKKAHVAGLNLKSPFERSLKLQPAEGDGELKPAEGRNAARTWHRWMRKKSSWPELYWLLFLSLTFGRKK